MRTTFLRSFLLSALTLSLVSFSSKPLQAQSQDREQAISTDTKTSSLPRVFNNIWYTKPFSFLYGVHAGCLHKVREQVFLGGELSWNLWNGVPPSIALTPTLRYYYTGGDATHTFGAYILLKAHIGCYYDLEYKKSNDYSPIYKTTRPSSTTLFLGAGVGTGIQIAVDKAGRFHLFSEIMYRFNQTEGSKDILPSVDGDHSIGSMITYYTTSCPTSPFEFSIGASYLF